MKDRNRPTELARKRPHSTPAMTIEGLRAQVEAGGGTLPIQPLDELSELVVEGIEDGRFIMIMPGEETAEKLRGRLERILANENPTEVAEPSL